ncbi:MAG: energy transducer TonB [Reichenbachiella sp.]
MELRKNPEIDLGRKRGMFFNIGLMISLSFVVTAFQWKFEHHQVNILVEEEDQVFTAMYEPVITHMDPPEKPEPIKEKRMFAHLVVAAAVDEIVKEDVLLKEEPAFDFDSMVFDEPLPVEEPDVYIGIVEVMPEPHGGIGSFYKFLNKEMRYPRIARSHDVTGKVFVQFVVGKEGQITDVEVIKGIGFGCDEEAKRVVMKAPSWKPGKQRGRPVKVRMIVPISFKLN